MCKQSAVLLWGEDTNGNGSGGRKAVLITNILSLGLFDTIGVQCVLIEEFFCTFWFYAFIIAILISCCYFFHLQKKVYNWSIPSILTVYTLED